MSLTASLASVLSSSAENGGETGIRTRTAFRPRRSDPLSYEDAGQAGGVEASRTPLHGFAGQPVTAPAPHLGTISQKNRLEREPVALSEVEPIQLDVMKQFNATSSVESPD
jgi:hypothetical protein